MIDIIISVYNSINTIERTLFSLCNQINKKDLMVYIVDDGSSENYDDIINYFSKKLNIVYVKLKENQGAGIAKQYGLDISKNEYIMFLDSDDELYDKKSVLNLYEGIKNYSMSQGLIYFEQLNEYTYHEGCLHGKLYRRSVLNKYNIKFNKLRSHEDNAFNQLYVTCCKKINSIEAVIYKYSYNEKSVTSTEEEDISLKNYIESMTWLFKEIEKRKLTDYKYISRVSVLTMYYCYFCYLKSNEKFKFVFNEMSYMKKNYIKYNKYIDEFEKLDLYNRMQFNFGYSFIPTITTYDFIDKIK